MCSPATCRSCGKTTWKGCGAHVEQVMAGVAQADRCTCDRTLAAPAAPGTGWLRRLRRR